ncbi:hypothetical protein FRC01_005956 [Tulasnella sp. 417]|nr:hypothetical protein FRC01_005956 [Tulasnella sp. 417]
MAADPSSLFNAPRGLHIQAPSSVPNAPTSVEDIMHALLFNPDSDESESESEVDNQEDWQDNANTVTGSIRGDTAEPDGDMGQHSTSDEEDQLISENGEGGEGEDAQVTLEEGEFMTMAVIDSFQGDYLLFFFILEKGAGGRSLQGPAMPLNSTFRRNYQGQGHAKVHLNVAQPPSFKSCICERSPSKKRVKHKSSKSAMHFCPNETCRKWLHQECLMKKPYILRRPPTTLLESQLVESVPEWDWNELLQYQSGYSPSSTPPDQLRQILFKVAGRQIIRGKGEPFANARPICFARALLKMDKDREAGEELDWHGIERIGFVKAELKRPVTAKDPTPLENCFWCPFCRSAI